MNKAGAGMGVGKSIAGYQDPDVCCTFDRLPSLSRVSLAEIGADIPWIQGITKLPLVIKGIQCVEV